MVLGNSWRESQQIRENKKTTKHRFKVSVGIGKVPVEYNLHTGLQDKYHRFPVTNKGFSYIVLFLAQVWPQNFAGLGAQGIWCII